MSKAHKTYTTGERGWEVFLLGLEHNYSAGAFIGMSLMALHTKKNFMDKEDEHDPPSSPYQPPVSPGEC